MRKFKSELGSITVVVFATVTFILIILATIFTTITMKRKSQQVELQELKLAYDGDMANIYEERVAKESTGLSEAQIAAINTHTGLQEISYKPAANASASVVIPSDKNGGATEQTFTQANLGTQSLKWYVLSADENGVNLVSQPTSTTVQFKDAGGYDNCLYYLNEISTNLFKNEAEFGVDSSRVHALNLSDIKKAAEKMNSSYNFDTTFLGGASKSSEVTNLGDSKTYGSETSYRKYPQIYGSGTGAITANNPMYDEEILANYEPKADLIANSSLASTLTINSTSCWYNDNSTCKTNLGDFGSSGIGGELFNSSGTNYWLASRCVYANSRIAFFLLRRVYSGYLGGGDLCDSNGSAYSSSYACRVVVSIPGSKVNVSADGTVTLKGDAQPTGPVIKDKDGATIDLANIANYYGHDVTYNGQTYQLFLVDTAGKYSNGESRIWLQYKGYVDGVTLSDHYETTGILTDNVNSKLWEVNPDLKTKYQANIRAIAESSLNNNIKGVAYLCNTANWNTTYVGTEGVNAGSYAIGGVSADMYCDSYTQATGTTFSARAYSENSTYGYRYKPGHSNASVNTDGYGYYSDYTNYPLTTEKGGMYNLGSGKNLWLASPSSYATGTVCYVNGNYGRLYCNSTPATYWVRPAVSLPSNIQIQLIS